MTDLASEPCFFRSIVSRVGPHLEASVIHGCLYEAWIVMRQQPQMTMKRFADDLMKEAMREAKVSKMKISLIYYTVRCFGGKVFNGTTISHFPSVSETSSHNCRCESCCCDSEKMQSRRNRRVLARTLITLIYLAMEMSYFVFDANFFYVFPRRVTTVFCSKRRFLRC